MILTKIKNYLLKYLKNKSGLKKVGREGNRFKILPKYFLGC